jgi:hypothetical protein
MAEQEFEVSSQRGRFAYNRLLKTSEIVEIPLTNCNYVLFKNASCLFSALLICTKTVQSFDSKMYDLYKYMKTENLYKHNI